MDCLKKIYREEGLRNGVFKGLLSTISREVPAYGGQFAAYFLTRRLLAGFKGVEE
jgi:hypothetical protein